MSNLSRTLKYVGIWFSITLSTTCAIYYKYKLSNIQLIQVPNHSLLLHNPAIHINNPPKNKSNNQSNINNTCINNHENNDCSPCNSGNNSIDIESDSSSPNNNSTIIDNNNAIVSVIIPAISYRDTFRLSYNINELPIFIQTNSLSDLTTEYARCFYSNKLFQIEWLLLHRLFKATNKSYDDYKDSINNCEFLPGDIIVPNVFNVKDRTPNQILNEWGIGIANKDIAEDGDNDIRKKTE
jgi:hypothetical protein